MTGTEDDSGSSNPDAGPVPTEVGGLPGRDGTVGGCWDDETVTRLWRVHRRWVAAVVYAHKPRDVDVDDLLQEVAMKLVRNMHRLADAASLKPWLRTVAINVARSAGRRTRARSKVIAFVDGNVANEMAAERADGIGPDRGGFSEDRTARGRGRRALELATGLPPHYREPLLLSLRGLSQRQIADVTGEPVTTIETRLIRARRMLRDELVAEESNETPNTATRAGKQRPSTRVVNSG